MVENPIKTDDLGVPLFFFGNIYIYIYIAVSWNFPLVFHHLLHFEASSPLLEVDDWVLLATTSAAERVISVLPTCLSDEHIEQRSTSK